MRVQQHLLLIERNLRGVLPGASPKRKRHWVHVLGLERRFQRFERTLRLSRGFVHEQRQVHCLSGEFQRDVRQLGMHVPGQCEVVQLDLQHVHVQGLCLLISERKLLPVPERGSCELELDGMLLLSG